MNKNLFTKALRNDWIEISHRYRQNRAAVAAIQIIIKCVDSSCGASGIFQLANDIELRYFDWHSYFEQRFRLVAQFDTEMLRHLGEPIGEAIGSFTAHTDHPLWLKFLADFLRETINWQFMVELIAQITAFLLFELCNLVEARTNTAPNDVLTRALIEISGHVTDTANQLMTKFPQDTQFTETFFAQLRMRLNDANIRHLSRTFDRFLTHKISQVNVIALSSILKMLTQQVQGYERLMDICIAPEFLAALNEIMETVLHFNTLRLAFKIAIWLQK